MACCSGAICPTCRLGERWHPPSVNDPSTGVRCGTTAGLAPIVRLVVGSIDIEYAPRLIGHHSLVANVR
jgi:hypothetical protein